MMPIVDISSSYSALKARLAIRGASINIWFSARRAKTADQRRQAICYYEGYRIVRHLRKSCDRLPSIESASLPKFDEAAWRGMQLAIGYVLYDLAAKGNIGLYRNALTSASVDTAAIGIHRYLESQELLFNLDTVIRPTIICEGTDPAAPIDWKWVRDRIETWSRAPKIWLIGRPRARKFHAATAATISPMLSVFASLDQARLDLLADKDATALQFDVAEREAALGRMGALAEVVAEREFAERQTLKALRQLQIAAKQTYPSAAAKTQALQKLACILMTALDPAFKRCVLFKVTTGSETIGDTTHPLDQLDYQAVWTGDEISTTFTVRTFKGQFSLPIDFPQTADPRALADAYKRGPEILDAVLRHIPDEIQNQPEFQAVLVDVRGGRIAGHPGLPLPGEGGSMMAKAVRTMQAQMRMDRRRLSEVPDPTFHSDKDSELWCAEFDPLEGSRGAWKDDIVRRTSEATDSRGQIALPFAVERKGPAGQTEKETFLFVIDGGAPWEDTAAIRRLKSNLSLYQQIVETVGGELSQIEHSTEAEATARTAAAFMPLGEAEGVYAGNPERDGDGVAIWLDISGYTPFVEDHADDPGAGSDYCNAFMLEAKPILLEHGFSTYAHPGDAILAGFVPKAGENFDESIVVRAFQACMAIQRRIAEINPHIKELGLPPIQLKMAVYPGKLAVRYFGTENERSLTLAGRPVNRAQRICSVSNSSLVLTPDAYRILKNHGIIDEHVEEFNLYILRYLVHDHEPASRVAHNSGIFQMIETLYQAAINDDASMRANVPLSHFMEALLQNLGVDDLLGGFIPSNEDDLCPSITLRNIKGIQEDLHVRNISWDRHGRRPPARWEAQASATEELADTIFECGHADIAHNTTLDSVIEEVTTDPANRQVLSQIKSLAEMLLAQGEDT
ncbi:MAG: hypothetical protein WC901_03960 [Candidatus Margulisiibacteriota bacterium]